MVYIIINIFLNIYDLLNDIPKTKYNKFKVLIIIFIITIFFLSRYLIIINYKKYLIYQL